VRRYWAEEFMSLAERCGMDCSEVRRVSGWIETAVVAERRCFTKSMTYNADRRLYFVGVHPRKLDEDGDAVLLCGGAAGGLRDVFVIPWDVFFDALRGGEPISTHTDGVRLQYKFYVRDRQGTWIMDVQRGPRPGLDIGTWRHDPVDALEAVKKL